ncbi:MAG: peptidoglycan-associated lipoprotein Pal [Deltaproteobacteria bacterium]|nr:peptidoglycan-associated lipoprotein Pal [Deltaproteobacteria bacterium]
MKRKYWVILAMLFIVPGLMLTASCAKKVVKPEAAVSKTDDSSKKVAPPAPVDDSAKSAALAAREKFMKQDVNFAFDSAVLDATAQAILKDKAGWMKSNMDAATTVEGHCDERGTVAYNIALGERRAEAAKAFLVNLGVPAAKMTTISYGKEKPLDPGHNEQAWAKNRRAHFVLK